jgi:hypothetical protein
MANADDKLWSSGSNPDSLISLLSALAQIESGNNPNAIGMAGEVTQYQILPSTLRYISRLRLQDGECSLANAPTSSGAVFVRRNVGDENAAYYLGIIQQRLRMALHREARPSELYAVWRLGFDGFMRRGFNLSRCPASVRDGARRFNNLLVHYNKSCKL